jgi:hypothetical protein
MPFSLQLLVPNTVDISGRPLISSLSHHPAICQLYSSLLFLFPLPLIPLIDTSAFFLCTTALLRHANISCPSGFHSRRPLSRSSRLFSHKNTTSTTSSTTPHYMFTSRPPHAHHILSFFSAFTLLGHLYNHSFILLLVKDGFSPSSFFPNQPTIIQPFLHSSIFPTISLFPAIISRMRFSSLSRYATFRRLFFEYDTIPLSVFVTIFSLYRF